MNLTLILKSQQITSVGEGETSIWAKGIPLIWNRNPTLIILTKRKSQTHLGHGASPKTLKSSVKCHRTLILST